MASPEIVDYARNFAVMVRVQGPDPKGLKMRKHAFHQYNSGKTTHSASGMLLPETLYDTEVAKHFGNHKDQFTALVVTHSSIFEPFMTLQYRDAVHQGKPELIPGVQIDIMVEDDLQLATDFEDRKRGAPQWHAAHLLASFDVPTSATALQSIIDASSNSTHHGWEVGWSLASHTNRLQIENDKKTMVGNQRYLDAKESITIGDLTTRITILGISSLSKDMPSITISPSRQRGSLIFSVGSPFGCLSPVHFLNCISVGSIANCYPPGSLSKSLMIADIRCLPGMEGSPVFDEHARLIGVLIRPLKHNISGAEIQLLIPWEAITTACSDLLLRAPNAGLRIDNDKGNSSVLGNETMIKEQKFDGVISCAQKHLSPFPFPFKVEKAMASVCLVTIDEGTWASGVLLNSQGLILTNAHLIEPWRFRKTNLSGGNSIENQQLFQTLTGDSVSSSNGVFGSKRSERLVPDSCMSVSNLLPDKHREGKLYANYGFRNLRVRVDHTEPWIWCDAKVVYVCKGALDVALLLLEQIPEQLSPIIRDCSWPSPGSKAYVIGHGLLGPKCGFSPSVCCGVVAKVVKAKMPTSYHQGDPSEFFPAMLETTAAVHPGGSGGAVVNPEGHMIGLVTSNARHGGGTIIPHLNFSIPCAALEPIFRFSKDMEDLTVLQVLDEPNEHLSSVWALKPPPPPKPSPSPQLVVEDHKEGKGSRFAKFMAERQEAFQKPSVHNKVEGLSSGKITSKL